MDLKNVITSVGIAAALSVSASAAQAFSFSQQVNGTNAKGDIWLESIQVGDRTIQKSQLSYVAGASIDASSDKWTGGNTGAASSERGDNASGLKTEDASARTVVGSLGNNNLNNIVDGEDKGFFKMNLNFSQAVSNLFFWERGMNSRLKVQALDTTGNLIGKFLVLGSDKFKWNNAGFQIDTTEIGGAQTMGSFGVSLTDLGVSGPINAIQVIAERDYNGPDFKVIGESAAAVPEPTTMAGLALAGSGLAWARRRKMKQA